MAEPVQVKQTGEKEIMVNSNRIYIDDKGIINYIASGRTDKETALHIRKAILELSQFVRIPAKVMVDLNKAGKPTTGSRKVFLNLPEEDALGKVAMYGGGPVSKVLGSFLSYFNKKNNMKFFNSKELAYEWLKN